MIKNILNWIEETFNDKENPDEAGYDPAHIGTMIVAVLFGITILFWLLWSLLVFGGGIFAKIIPFIKIMFTSRTAADYGYVGYPYEMGVFEGWPTNVVALVFAILLICAIWYVFKKGVRKNGN